jgi:hypothetical protein
MARDSVDVNILRFSAYWSNIMRTVYIKTGLVTKIWQSLLLTWLVPTLTITQSA